MNVLTAVLPANVARTNFYQMIDEVGDKLKRFVISHRGKSKVVVMPLEDVEAWEETLEILSDKKLMKDLKSSKSDYKRGKYLTLDQIEEKYATALN